MTETTSTPRRPIVPGPTNPTNQGIAAKAIALREMKEKGITPTLKTPMDWEREQQEKRMDLPYSPVILPFQGVGNLAKGIAGVMAEVGTIQKSGFNKFHNYAYATLQDLLFAVTPLMGKHGVCVIQNEKDRVALEGGRVQVTYEFSIFHTSGEIWPERPRFTGMAIGKDSKGNWDDKVINKCHSAARKYFLLSLFQVPSGDFDEADEGPAQQAVAPKQPNPTQRAVPQQQPKPPERPRTVPGPASQPKEPVVDERLPHKIGFTPGMTADQWANAYLKVINAAASQQEMTEWDGLNDAVLQRLSDKYPEVYEQIRAASEQRMESLAPATPKPDGMPNPKDDPGGAMQWIAQALIDQTTYEGAEAFWNGTVAPREAEFDPADWEMLMNEWKRAEIRLNTDVEPEPPEM